MQETTPASTSDGRERSALLRQSIGTVAGARADAAVNDDREGGLADERLVAQSGAMRSLIELAKRVAPATTPVLIGGETGSGKGVIARAIHGWGPRGDRPCLQLNCGAVADRLLESELFGHRRGSFTGAIADKEGIFETADGGTLILDEVAEMSPKMQAKLLQVLDTGHFRRVGGTRLRRVDVRVLAATGKDLEAEIRERRFRSDLYYRLAVIKIEVPPLRKRSEDLEALTELFLRRFRVPGEPVKSFSPRALEQMRRYVWPGNVRELVNVVENAVLMTRPEVIELEDLPAAIRTAARSIEAPAAEPAPLADVLQSHVLHTLDYTGGHRAAAARLLGINVKTLSSRLKAFGSRAPAGRLGTEER